MNLDGAMRIAQGGLANIDRRLALVSQNVANADTPDYARQVGTQTSLTAAGQGLGVVAGPSVRRLDTALQAALFAQDGAVSAATVTSGALKAIDAVHGVPGDGTDLPSRLGALRDGFSALLGDPANQAQQNQVIARAGALAEQLNALSGATMAQRQAAHDDAVAALGELTRALDAIGALTTRIMTLKAGGTGTADLENQRDAALHVVTGLVGGKALVRDNGDLLVVTEGGLVLPTHDAASLLTLAPASLQPGTWYPGGGVPGIMLRGQDVTAQMTGGRIGADLALRDRVLPTFQAQLDAFAVTLAQRFDAQGLTLFTDPTGAVPAGGGTPVQAGCVGFAATIRVNPAVVETPSLLRDGSHDVAASPDGPDAFSVNPGDGPAGFTTLIRRILDHALGAEIRPGLAHAAPAVTGLGPSGGLSAGFAAPLTLADFAAAVVAAQSAVSSGAQDRVETETALRDRLAERHAAVSGVNLDTEMATMLMLQTAYGATARVLTVIQSLFDELMRAMR